MRIDLVFPKLPPALDGIGDHTALLAAALCAAGHDVRILTAQDEATPINGVTIQRAFSMNRRNGITALEAEVASDPPDWLFVQFNQFSYGRWGLNPFVPFVLQQIRHRYPRTRVAVMFHEDFVPMTSAKFAIMTTWQRAQFWSLGQTADVVFFSIQPWVERYRSWFRNASVHHLPVGSNIPFCGLSRRQARSQLGISPEVTVAGVFGSAHGSRLLGFVRRASEAIQEQEAHFVLLYVGPHGAVVRSALDGVRVVDAGALPAESVSLHLSAMDVHLAPFVDGVSTRRGSFMAGIQHGLPTVSTVGPLTDQLLAGQDRKAFLLVDEQDEQGFINASVELVKDANMRKSLGQRATAFYHAQFEWSVLAGHVTRCLDDCRMPRSERVSSVAAGTV